jgi:hypothetical protein
MVRLVIGGEKLLDHPGYDEEVVFLPGRIGEGLGDGQTGPHHVGAQAVFQVCFTKQRNLGDVDFGELADVAEHVAELFLEGRNFLGREAEPREVGDIGDVDAFGRGIGHKQERLSKKSARVTPKGWTLRSRRMESSGYRGILTLSIAPVASFYRSRRFCWRCRWQACWQAPIACELEVSIRG